MNTLFVPLLTFIAVILLGAGFLIALSLRRRRLAPRLQTSPESLLAPDMSAAPSGIAARIAAAMGGAISMGSVSSRLKETLSRAGYYNDSAAAVYLGAKWILLLAGILPTALFILPSTLSIIYKLYLSCLLLGFLFFLPNFILRLKRRHRLTDIRNHLPDAVDLLEICVSSGMGLDMAWNAVTDEIRRVSRNLADEMSLVNLEIQLGATRTDAMRNMGARTGADDITSLVAMLHQSERFGTSIGEALRTFAVSMREIRSLRAEEEAEKMAVKLLFPLVFFIFPVMLIVMVGPAAMTLYEVMGPG